MAMTTKLDVQRFRPSFTFEGEKEQPKPRLLEFTSVKSLEIRYNSFLIYSNSGIQCMPLGSYPKPVLLKSTLLGIVPNYVVVVYNYRCILVLTLQ